MEELRQEIIESLPMRGTTQRIKIQAHKEEEDFISVSWSLLGQKVCWSVCVLMYVCVCVDCVFVPVTWIFIFYVITHLNTHTHTHSHIHIQSTGPAQASPE